MARPGFDRDGAFGFLFLWHLYECSGLMNVEWRKEVTLRTIDEKTID